MLYLIFNPCNENIYIQEVDKIADISNETKATKKIIQPPKIEVMDSVKTPSTQNAATVQKSVTFKGPIGFLVKLFTIVTSAEPG